MLTELQRRLAGVVAELREAEGFALAGGAALILQGYPERVTADLDYFATSAKAVDALLPALESALTTHGLKVERLQVASGFARLEVSDAGEVCQVDLGYDYRLREAELTRSARCSAPRSWLQTRRWLCMAAPWPATTWTCIG